MKKAILIIPVFLMTALFCFCQPDKSYPAANDSAFDSGSTIVFPEPDKRITENLELLGKLWGFLKYHHPKIGDGKYNWDYELFRMLPEYLAVTGNEQRDSVLLAWIDKYGPLPDCSNCKETPPDAYLKPDLSWVKTLTISSPLKAMIEKIYQNRHQGAHYYISINQIGVPTFLHENTYANMPYPDEGFRLLALYRFWNYFRYFSPYRNLTDKDWNMILKEYIPKFLNAKDQLQYELAVLQLLTETDDTHAGVLPVGRKIIEAKGKKFAPFRVRFIENKLVVTEFLTHGATGNTGLKIGDIITHISGEPVEKIIDSLWSYYPASNSAAKLRDIAANILRSNQSTIPIQYIADRQNKKTILRLFPADSLNLFDRSSDSSYKMLNETTGYIAAGALKMEDLGVIREQFGNTKGIIIDLRKGVAGNTPLLLAPFFISKPTPYAKATKGNINNPGEFQFIAIPELQHWGGVTYSGKLIVLVNEYTQSIGEFTAMAFRAGNNTTIIGSTTAGTDGTACEVSLPCNLKAMLTGNGIFYPDGVQTQRTGIVPNTVITPTIEGIKQGKDEVLEKAIAIINDK